MLAEELKGRGFYGLRGVPARWTSMLPPWAFSNGKERNGAVGLGGAVGLEGQTMVSRVRRIRHFLNSLYVIDTEMVVVRA
jgi:hypothetical protein